MGESAILYMKKLSMACGGQKRKRKKATRKKYETGQRNETIARKPERTSIEWKKNRHQKQRGGELETDQTSKRLLKHLRAVMWPGCLELPQPPLPSLRKNTS
jgi:hypothetical protein